MSAAEPTGTETKLARLREILSGMSGAGGALAAFSGGVDSSLLVAVAHEVMGERLLAATAVSPTTPRGELDHARGLARSLGFRHVEVETREFDTEEFRANTPERCYHCKRVRFGELARLARREGLPFVMDGSNLDDLDDFRPGERAATELGVRRPLREAALTKAEIRRISRELGLPGWARPSSACLASRIPYGEPLARDTLRRVDQAESFLRGLGYERVRVRVHSGVARIEMDPERLAEFAGKHAREAARRLSELGFAYVALDLAGYRTGSLNEVLHPGRGERGKGGE